MARLVTTIEAKARAKLAHRLAPIANAPANVIHMLAFDDDIEVAQPGAGAVRTARRPRSGQRRHQEPAAPVRHLAAPVAERGGDRRAGRARRPRGRPFGGQKRRRAVFRRRLPHAGQALDRRRRAGDRGRAAPRHSAAAFPGAPGKASNAVRDAPGRGKSASRHRHRRGRRRGGRRHPHRGPQRLAGFRRRAGRRRAAKPPPPASANRKSTNMRATANSRRPRSRCRSCAIPRSTSSSGRCSTPAPRSCSFSPRSPACPRPRPRRSCCCAPPTAACRRKTSNRRCRASTAAARYRPARAQLLPHPREKAGGADGPAGGRRQRLN